MTEEGILIRKCKKAVPAAQKELYQKYRSQWFMICLRYSRRRADALDILQNSLIKIFMKIKQFDENYGSFIAWSSRIVVNESIMFLRKQMKYMTTEELTDSYYDMAEEDQSFESLDSKVLTKLVQRLPDGYRLVFNLYAIEGYTHKEIASILEISVGTSKSQYFKAKNMLRKQIEVLI